MFINDLEILSTVRVNPPFSEKCDHNTVVFELNLTINQPNKTLRRMWSKADVGGITTFLEMQNWDVIFAHCHDVDDMWITFRMVCMNPLMFLSPFPSRIIEKISQGILLT